MQNRIPNSSSLCPSMPRNWTCDRLGMRRLASPPGVSAGGRARAGAAVASIPKQIHLRVRLWTHARADISRQSSVGLRMQDSSGSVQRRANTKGKASFIAGLTRRVKDAGERSEEHTSELQSQ